MAPNTLQLACLTTPLLTLTILSLPSSSFIRQCLYPIPAVLFLRALFWPPKFSASDNEAVQEAFKLGTLYASFAFAFAHYLYAYGYDTPEYFYKVRWVEGSGKDGDGKGGYERVGYPEDGGFWGRFKWSLSLVTALRGVGWNFQVSGLPKTRFARSRGECVRETAVTIVISHLSWLTAGAICGFFARLLRDEELAARYLFLYALVGKNLVVQMAAVSAAWGVRNIAFTMLVSSYLKIVFVGFGIGGGEWSDPARWYRMFGGLGDCWSVRSVWGRVWHQSIRKCIQVPGDKIAALVFGTDPKSLPQPIQLLRRFFLLFSAFAVSGFIHAAGSYFIIFGMDNYNPPTEGPPWYYTFYFFISQAFVIAIEEVVFWALGVSNTPEEVGKSKVRWVVGVGYTTLWFIWCTTVLWADPESRVVGFVPAGVGEGYAHVFDRIDRF
ncbi:hypothetical protein TWF718_007832 [Orbilia javanica]|uniref:Wax synthase domain-containing protein n=1 Tax=Orbilia javanica TaxID=47235 RepID=A0AAN8RH66_9PEZI